MMVLHLTVGISLQLSRYKAPISQWSVQLMSKVRTEKKCSTGLCYNLHMLNAPYTDMQIFQTRLCFMDIPHHV